ncbi:unnamed protein product, partial [Rotaria sp. Silwood1]
GPDTPINSIPLSVDNNKSDGNGQYTIQYTGYIPELIKLLTDTVGFNATLILAPTNKTYTQIVQLVNTGDFDIIVGDVTVTSQRRESVGFSNAIFDNSLRLMMRKTPDINVDLFEFLRPFSLRLWGLAFATCIYADILMCLIERVDNEDLQDRSIISQLTLSIWYCFGNIVG